MSSAKEEIEREGEGEEEEPKEEDEDDEDDEDDEPLSLSSILRDHWPAIVIAVVATAVAFFFQTQQRLKMEQQQYDIMMRKTDTLANFARTSHLQFCRGKRKDDDESSRRGKSNTMLKLQLRIPEHLYGTMEQYYRADATKDDYYERLEETSPVTINSEEYQCMIDQQMDRLHNKPRASIVVNTRVYETPSIASITGYDDAEAASLSFTGFAAQFINLSAKPVVLHWEDRAGGTRRMGEIGAMEVLGTTISAPGQDFYISPTYDKSHALKRWVATADDTIYVYDAFDPNDRYTVETAGSIILQELYDMHKLNLLFARDYLVTTHRTWLSMFPRPPPAMNLWEEATEQYQEFWVSTEAGHIHAPGSSLSSTSSPSPLEIKLKVASIVPKVLVIDDFLSEYECQYIIDLSKKATFEESTVMDGADPKGTRDAGTRSSTTAFVTRDPDDKTMQTIYKRAAAILKMDPSVLLNHQAESLQVVHYRKDEQYTPHHDFVAPPILHRYQPTRAATLLLYLNTPKRGGETYFPRAVQATNHDGIVVKPVMGKAALFYNMLPDGNADELSIHGSKPIKGNETEKWVANLWIWDPMVHL